MTNTESEAVAWRWRANARHAAHYDGWPYKYETSPPVLPSNIPTDHFDVEPLFPASSLASRDARIAELEKDVLDWQAIAADRQAGHSLAEARALKAEALLEEAVKGLEAISFAKAFGRDVPSLEDLITDNRQTARATLTAITKDQDQ